MERLPIQLGVAELQSTFGSPDKLVTLANRIAGLRDRGHRHAVSQCPDGTLAFVVRAASGADHRSTAGEFSIYVAECLILLRREWPALIADRWNAIRARLDAVRPSLPEAVKREVREALIAGIDEFDFDSPLTMESWALIRAHRVVEHRLQTEREASRPIYSADGSKNDAARITFDHYRAIDPLAQLFRHEDLELGADLALKVRRQINALRPPSVREVVKLRLLNRRTFREIADRLRIPLQTAVSRFEAAKRKLREAASPADLTLLHDLLTDESAMSESKNGAANTGLQIRRACENKI